VRWYCRDIPARGGIRRAREKDNRTTNPQITKRTAHLEANPSLIHDLIGSISAWRFLCLPHIKWKTKARRTHKIITHVFVIA
jgi:hypothetical protein